LPFENQKLKYVSGTTVRDTVLRMVF